MKRIYNIFARAIKDILQMDISEHEYAEIIASISGNRIGSNIFEGLPSQLVDNSGIWKEILPSTVNEPFCDELERYYRKSKEKNENLVFLVYCLDKSLKGTFDAGLCMERDVEELKPLNTNVGNTQIAIFPRVKCRWEHNSQGRCYRNNLENFMHNFYYCETGKIRGVEIHNYIVSKSIFKGLRDKKELTVAVSPVTDKDVLEAESYEREGKLYFHINKLKEQDTIKENLKSIIEQAVTKKADIVLFPEMLGSEDIINDIQSTSNFGETPALVVWPSVWKKTKNDAKNTNTSVITLHKGKYVLKICRQCKKNAFEMPDDHSLEDLSHTKTWGVNIISCEGIGRIGVLICKDFLIDDNRKLLCETLKTTLMLIPSYTTGAHNFDILLPQFFERDCNIAWCNTCSASNIKSAKIENFSKIAAITLYGANRNNSENYVHYYKGAVCCTNKDCKNCLYIGRIPFV